MVKQISLRAFVRKHGVRLAKKTVDRNPHMDVGEIWNATASHWLCELRKADGSRFRLYFSQGSGNTRNPRAVDLLDCLASDCSGVESGGDFHGWCQEYGNDEDSRRHLRTFRILRKQAERLSAFLGDDAYQELLYNTERL